jgi:hypothetical protein
MMEHLVLFDLGENRSGNGWGSGKVRREGSRRVGGFRLSDRTSAQEWSLRTIAGSKFEDVSSEP